MKIGKTLGWILLSVLVGMQFYRSEKNSSQENHTAIFLSETNPPQHVKQILETTCYDCHSHNTNYPWYAAIAPASYWMAEHIRVGKGHLNFSDWENYSRKEKDHKLEEMVTEIEKGEMPLKEYTWMHEDAILTATQKQMVIEWANRTRALYQLGPLPE